MTECEYTAVCEFFVSEVGYSPELNHKMKQQFCLEDNAGCARLLAKDAVGADRVPPEMLPTDRELLSQLQSGAWAQPPRECPPNLLRSADSTCPA